MTLVPMQFAAKNNPKAFKTALNRLGSDEAFRASVTKDPELLLKDHSLSIRELAALRQAAILAGVDMKTIDKVRLQAIQATDASAAVDINVSCCCCCCCGETAVLTTHA